MSELPRMPHLALSCGGTGGHFYPGLTIASEYQRAGGQVTLFIGGRHAAEQLRVAANAGLPAVPAPAEAVGTGKLRYLHLAARLPRAILQARHALRAAGVQATLCMGSYAGFPIGLAAKSLGLPLYLHEGNAIIGEANRRLSGLARCLYLTLPPLHEPRRPSQQPLVGMPLRQAIIAAASEPLPPAARLVALEARGLDPRLPVLLVFGGSQGAQVLNARLPEAVISLPPSARQFQVCHLTGQEDNTAIIAAWRRAGVPAQVWPRDPAIHELYQLATWVVCRAGAASIMELANFGLPTLLIPYAAAKDNHQEANARAVEGDDAGWLLREPEATPTALASLLTRWQSDPAECARRGARFRTLAKPRATPELIQHLLADFATLT
jgi:UDP-N-acetylglucosamine--N-acetylmuramyl-(pentapeptide) pyrophosphoryl-undecaprenol N-acetylglucosamine transferase